MRPFPALCAIAAPAFSAQKPNIILIMADDIGYGDIGCHGSGRNPTPHLDALAKQGMRFTEENKDKPFFLYLPHLTPHSPYQGPGARAIRGKAARQGARRKARTSAKPTPI